MDQKRSRQATSYIIVHPTVVRRSSADKCGSDYNFISVRNIYPSLCNTLAYAPLKTRTFGGFPRPSWIGDWGRGFGTPRTNETFGFMK
jgi:hypothetical protein